MKKKFKEAELNELKETLKAGWVSKVGKEEGFLETWQVVQDAAHYSFNASHSLCVALDSLYGAYLKSHYPLEYFTVALSLYSDDLDRTAKLISEMKYFNIKLEPIKFRYSISDYNMDKNTNSIYKGVGAIKYMNKDVADKLYEMKDNDFPNFVDLLRVFPGNSRQLDILIKLGYFSEFGGALKLIKINDFYTMYNGKKIIKKNKLNLPVELIEKYCESETEKQYRFSDAGMRDLINYVCGMIPDGDIPLRTRIESEFEYLGYISYINPKLRNIGLVTDLNTNYTPKATIYMLDSGKTITAKISKMLYQKNPVEKNDFIKFTTYKKQKCKKVNDEWVKMVETEDWIQSYIIKNAEL